MNTKVPVPVPTCGSVLSKRTPEKTRRQQTTEIKRNDNNLCRKWRLAATTALHCISYIAPRSRVRGINNKNSTQTNTRRMQCILKFNILKRFGAGMHSLLFAFYFTFALFSPIHRSGLRRRNGWSFFVHFFVASFIYFDFIWNISGPTSDWNLSLLPRHHADYKVCKTWFKMHYRASTMNDGVNVRNWSYTTTLSTFLDAEFQRHGKEPWSS